MYRNRLTEDMIRDARHSGTTTYAERIRDGAGLMLVVQPKGEGKSWIIRMQKDGKRRDVGLGSWPEVSLDLARALISEVRREVKAHGLAAQITRIFRTVEDSKTSPHFQTVWNEYIEIRKQGWKGEASLIDWQGTFTHYLEKPFQRKMIHTIGSNEITRVLRPIWHSKNQTAKKVLSRIQQVMSYAREMAYIDTVPEAGRSLGKSRTKKEHRKMLPVAQAPTLYRWLALQSSPQATALRLVMLTACRDMEVRGADWSEIDLKANVFTLSAERMKADKPHTVYLGKDAAILLRMLQPKSSGLIWPDMNHMQFSRLRDKAVKETGVDKFDIHGLRTTFAEWTQLEGFNDLASKACIAHQTHTGAAQAYFRGEGLVPERIKIMEGWGRYLSGRNS